MPLNVLNANQNYFTVGGSDTYFFALAALLEANGHQVIPFASSQSRNLETKWAEYFPASVDFNRPSPIDLARFIYSLPAAAAIKKLLSVVNCDVAHLHIYYGQLTASILQPLRRRSVPIVQTLHEYKVVCPTSTLFSGGSICEDCQGREFWRAAAKRCNRGSFARSTLSAAETYVSRWLGSVDHIDHFIAVSDFLRDKVIALGVPSEKITTVHNFIDCSNREVATGEGSYILYFGRLEKIKGIYTLLDAIAPLRDIPLLIVGDGSERDEVEAMIASRALSHVKLLGFKRGEELHDLIRGSVCTVSPSEWYETFGLTLVESFAHGRPVISSRIGGMTEVVTDGDDGFLVPPGAADILRERLQWMWSHKSEAAAMGLRGRSKVEQQFSPQRHYSDILSVYRKVGVQC